MSKWIGLTVLATAVAVMALGCGQQPAATAAVTEDKSSPAIQVETFDRAFIP